MLILLIFILILTSISLLMLLAAALFSATKNPQGQKPAAKISRKPASVQSYKIDKKRLMILFIAGPVVGVILGSMLFNKNMVAIIIGMTVGLLLPLLSVKGYKKRITRKFESQLPDSLMILTSCLRGGLSLIQSIEVLTEEMSWPTNQEFGQVIKEHKMGISLQESLDRLNSRVNSEDLVLLNSAIMVSRETGGDLTEVFDRLHHAIIERNKLFQNIKTLTLQGRIQSLVLSVLPIVFTIGIYKVNPSYFQLMMSSDTGRIMLLIAAFLLAVGLFLVKIFSKVEV